MACIHIWTIEHRSRLRAEDVSRPKLEAHILTIMVGNINGKTALTLVVAVFNHGAPSIVKDSKVTVQLADGKQIAATPILRGPGDQELTGEPGTPNVKLTYNNYFPDKAIERPIPQGGGVSGWIIYTVPDVSQEELRSINTQITFEVRDINGTSAIAKGNFVTGAS